MDYFSNGEWHCLRLENKNWNTPPKRAHQSRASQSHQTLPTVLAPHVPRDEHVSNRMSYNDAGSYSTRNIYGSPTDCRSRSILTGSTMSSRTRFDSIRGESETGDIPILINILMGYYPSLSDTFSLPRLSNNDIYDIRLVRLDAGIFCLSSTMRWNKSNRQVSQKIYLSISIYLDVHNE